MWCVSTFEKINDKKIFFVSTFLDWYKCAFMTGTLVHCKCYYKNVHLVEYKNAQN